MGPEVDSRAPDQDLPFYCPKMRSGFLLRPCEKNLAHIKALRVKASGAHLGPLEHCLGCRGNERHRDKHRKLLPFCQVCYSERGRHNLVPGAGRQPGDTLLKFPKEYAAEAKWFWAQCGEQVRNPMQQIVYLCKRAMLEERRGD